MSISDSASPSVVNVSGLVDLYTTTLQRHGYASTATQPTSAPLNISLIGPRLIPSTSRSEKV